MTSRGFSRFSETPINLQVFNQKVNLFVNRRITLIMLMKHLLLNEMNNGQLCIVNNNLGIKSIFFFKYI